MRLLPKCEIVLKDISSGGTEVDTEWVEELRWKKAIGLKKYKKEFFANKTVTEDFGRWNCLEAIAKLASLIILSNTVYTRR